MSMVYVMIPLALGLLLIAVLAFIWASKSGQFDDLDSPGWSIILDEDPVPDGKTGKGSAQEDGGNEPG